jgi:hypothetical protein
MRTCGRRVRSFQSAARSFRFGSVCVRLGSVRFRSDPVCVHFGQFRCAFISISNGCRRFDLASGDVFVQRFVYARIDVGCLVLGAIRGHPHADASCGPRSYSSPVRARPEREAESPWLYLVYLKYITNLAG